MREVRRRQILIATGALLAAPSTVSAQPANRIYRIGILNDGDERTRQKDWSAFREQLLKLGLVEGKNIVLDTRHARGRTDLLPKLAADLVAAKPDVIVCPGTPPSHAAKNATSSIPIIFLAAGDPVGTKLIASLSRPGGNVTGVSVVATEIIRKSMELLHEIVPGIQRVGLLSDPSNPFTQVVWAGREEFARPLKLLLWLLDGAGEAALETSFATIRRERIEGLYVEASGTLLNQREKIVQFAARATLPVVYGRHDYTEVGGLLSYEADRRLAYERGADLVNRVLRGARPADLPVEQTSNFRMVLNMKTARAQGIAIPAALRVRADEIIE